MGSKIIRAHTALLVELLILTPSSLLACSVCFGAVDSPMTLGMTWAVVVLIGITGSVICAFAAFFVYLYKRSRMMLAQELNLPESIQPEREY